MLKLNLRWLCGSEFLGLAAAAAFVLAFVPDPLPYLAATAVGAGALATLRRRAPDAVTA
ncbi:MAG TPA: hypothetical protein VNZ52_16390 [Candidatus Thermoplasmatota archaeon]|nr:hypothetical protein [Candidatus Thermoplasmatota archaeon]